MKKHLGAKNCLYPTLTTLVGAHVGGKPNYVAIAHVGIADLDSITIGINKRHHTTVGIEENGAFSVNVPSADMVEITDYFGLVSGRDVDKGALVETFYGQLEAAPMIKGCPVNMACRLIHTADMPKHKLFVGQVVETYCDQDCLTDDVLDLAKVQPILFAMVDRSYWRLGERLAQAWSVGKTFETCGGES